MRQLSLKRHRFTADIIRHSVWLYARFTLSYRVAVAVQVVAGQCHESDCMSRIEVSSFAGIC